MKDSGVICNVFVPFKVRVPAASRSLPAVGLDDNSNAPVPLFSVRLPTVNVPCAPAVASPGERMPPDAVTFAVTLPTPASMPFVNTCTDGYRAIHCQRSVAHDCSAGIACCHTGGDDVGSGTCSN